MLLLHTITAFEGSFKGLIFKIVEKLSMAFGPPAWWNRPEVLYLAPYHRNSHFPIVYSSA